MTKSILPLGALILAIACSPGSSNAPPESPPTERPKPAPSAAASSEPVAPRDPAPDEPATERRALSIYHIDVEQGDATLLVAPAGGTLLVDAGSTGHGERIDALLKQLGRRIIDYLVVTHYDDDHYGGLAELMENVKVVQAFDRGGKKRLSGKIKFSKAFESYSNSVGAAAEPLVAGDRINVDPDMTVTCIASGGGTYGSAQRARAQDEKDLGIALLVEFGQFRYFIGGDVHTDTERRIVESGLAGDVDVYRANDHGSDQGSSKSFVEALSPSVVIVSNGGQETEPHPSRATLDTFASLPKPPTVFQTNKQLSTSEGAANVADTFIADPEAKDADGTILLEVPTHGERYEVSYGDASHAFAIRPSRRSEAKIVISSLLPDPAGSDRELEEVTIKNKSEFVIDVSRWLLKNRTGDVWSLVSLGTLDPNSEKTVVRRGMGMSLNNAGDKIFLVDDNQKVIDEFEYQGSTRDERIQTGH